MLYIHQQELLSLNLSLALNLFFKKKTLKNPFEEGSAWDNKHY